MDVQDRKLQGDRKGSTTALDRPRPYGDDGGEFVFLGYGRFAYFRGDRAEVIWGESVV